MPREDYSFNIPRPTERIMGGIQQGLGIGSALEQREQRNIQFEQAQEDRKTAAVRQQWDRLTKEKQSNQLRFGGKVIAALGSSPKFGIDLLTDRAAAERNAGNEQEAAEYDRWADIAELNPEGVRKSIITLMSTLPGGTDIVDSISKTQGVGAKLQFGGQQTFKDSKGNLFFGTTKRDPGTGDVESVLAPIGSGPKEPIGAVSIVSGAGVTSAEKVKQAIDIQQQTGDIKTQQAIQKQVGLELNSKEKQQVIELTKVKIDETKLKTKEAKIQAINVKKVRRDESLNAVSVIDGLLTGDRFEVGFGKIASTTPELLRPQETLDVQSEIEQVVNLIGLEARQKLKGQGTVSDSEANALAKSATTLANPLISTRLARKELERVRNIFRGAAERNKTEEIVEAVAPHQIGRFQIEVVK